ncbi:hypothetical protein S7335_1490 [Synechococcus sp. PCC 7335]|nr:hypothetical protein S7335_1490 [Synechococcus sp. PCC 7335]
MSRADRAKRIESSIFDQVIVIPNAVVQNTVVQDQDLQVMNLSEAYQIDLRLNHLD